MYRDQLNELYAKLEKEQSICAWAALYAATVWNKIGFMRSLVRGRIFETTLTQDLLFQFYTMANDRQLPIELYEALDETSNGNDLELFIEKRDGYIHVPIQAKLIDRDGKYGRLHHKIGHHYQIDLLLSYAKSNGALPLYLLYNHSATAARQWPDGDEHNHDNIPFDNAGMNLHENTSIQEYGCSIVAAKHLKDLFCTKPQTRKTTNTWKTPGFPDIHPSPALPFSALFCKLVKDPVERWSEILHLQKLPTLQAYSYNQVVDKKTWRDKTPPATIGRIRGFEENLITDNFLEKEPTVFNPKFRIIMSNERKSKGALYFVY